MHEKYFDWLTKIEMTSHDVLEFYNACKEAGIEVWLDGGWAVDALLGKQTREHADLDIAIQENDVTQLRELMSEQGYEEIKFEEARPHNFVLGDNKGHQLDVHVMVFDEKGNGIYGPPENGDMYPAESLSGNGIINDTKVKCISAKTMVDFLSPWISKHPHKYVQAVSALCEKFNIQLPKEYLGYQNNEILK